MFASDHDLEAGATKAYGAGILACGDATGEILEHVLTGEDRHIDRIREVQDEISQMGILVFPSTQLK